MPAVMDEMYLSAAQVGLITGTMFLGYAVAVWTSGFIPLSRHTAVIGGAVISVLGHLGFVLSHTVPLMLAMALISGAGVGIYLPRGVAVLAEAFPPTERARAFSVHEVAAMAAMMLGPLFLGVMMPLISWRGALALWSVVGLVAIVLFWRYVPPERADADGAAAVDAARLALDGRMVSLVGVGMAVFILLMGFVSVLPVIVATGWQVSPAAAASFVGLTRIGAVVGSVFGGLIADRFGRMQALFVAYSVPLVMLLFLYNLDYGLLFGVAVTVLTLTASVGTPAYYALVGDTYPAHLRARAAGVIGGTATMFGVVVTPVLLGWVLDHFAARNAFLVVMVTTAVGFAAMYWYRSVMRAQACSDAKQG